MIVVEIPYRGCMIRRDAINRVCTYRYKMWSILSYRAELERIAWPFRTDQACLIRTKGKRPE